MNTIKIILGTILGLYSLITIVKMVGESSGAGLMGGFFGFLIFGGIAFWLISSGVKGNQINNENNLKDEK